MGDHPKARLSTSEKGRIRSLFFAATLTSWPHPPPRQQSLRQMNPPPREPILKSPDRRGDIGVMDWACGATVSFASER